MANGMKLIPNYKKSLTSFEIIDLKKTFGRGKTLRRAEVLKTCYLNFYRYDQFFFFFTFGAQIQCNCKF